MPNEEKKIDGRLMSKDAEIVCQKCHGKVAKAKRDIYTHRQVRHEFKENFKVSRAFNNRRKQIASMDPTVALSITGLNLLYPLFSEVCPLCLHHSWLKIKEPVK